MISIANRRGLVRAQRLALAAVLVALVPLVVRSGLGLFVVPPYALVGAILVVRRPGNAIGWDLVASGIGFAILLVPSIHATATGFQDGTAPLVEQGLGVLTGGATGMALFLCLFLLALIFPSGRWPAGRRGRLLRWVVGVAAAATVACFFRPTITVPLDGLPTPATVHNPLSIARTCRSGMSSIRTCSPSRSSSSSSGPSSRSSSGSGAPGESSDSSCAGSSRQSRSWPSR